MTDKQNDLQKTTKSYAAYAGLGMQFLVGIVVASLGGKYLDKWLGASFPIFVWALPILVIVGIIYKLVKQLEK